MGFLHPVTHWQLWLELLSILSIEEAIQLQGLRQLQKTCFVGFTLKDRSICPDENQSWSLLKVDPVLQHFLRHLEQGHFHDGNLPVTAVARMFSDSWALRLSFSASGPPLWPPWTVLSAELRLARRPTEDGRARPKAVRVKEEIYSRGTGRCRIASSKAPIPGTLVHDNCHGEDWDRRFQPNWFHCPLNVPVALESSSKSGSTSVGRWALQMDFPKGRDFALMAASWSPHAGTHAERQHFLDWATRWFFPDIMDEDANEEDPEIRGRLRELAQPLRFGGASLTVPASSCLTCCRHGIGRVKVMVVRNPYARFVSAYRAMFLDSQRIASKPFVTNGFMRRNCSLEWDFQNFLSFLSSAKNYMLGAVGENPMEEVKLAFDAGGTTESTEMSKLTLYSIGVHAGPLRNRSDIKEFHLIHLERVVLDVQLLERRLCEQLAYCRPLPPLLRANAGRRPVTTLTGVWLRALKAQQERLLRRYRADFLDLGYWEDPERMQDVNVEG
eukprot:symbB.v1.2.003798.t1/scaffold192.1/size616647/9